MILCAYMYVYRASLDHLRNLPLYMCLDMYIYIATLYYVRIYNQNYCNSIIMETFKQHSTIQIKRPIILTAAVAVILEHYMLKSIISSFKSIIGSGLP